jgi:hypothetical protein
MISFLCGFRAVLALARQRWTARAAAMHHRELGLS